MTGKKLLALTPRRVDLPSGAEVALLSTLQWLVARGWDVSAVCGQPSPTHGADGVVSGVRCHFGHRDPSVADLCASLRPDVALLQLGLIRLSPGFRARGVPVATTLHLQGDAAEANKFAESLSLVVPNCSETARMLLGARRLCVLHPPLGDPARWRATRAGTPWTPGCRRPLRVAQVNVADVKGGALFRWLARQVCPSEIEFVAVLGGYGNQRVDDMPANVSVVGPVGRIADVLAGVDLLMLPSLNESYGMVVREALLSGIPVLASDLPGVREATAGAGAAVTLLPPASQTEWLGALSRLREPGVYAAALAGAAAFAASRMDDEEGELLAFESALVRAIEEDGGRRVPLVEEASVGKDHPKHARRAAAALAASASGVLAPVAPPAGPPAGIGCGASSASSWPIGARLHIGCGGKLIAGWLNTDTKPGVGPDGVVDLYQLGNLPSGVFSAAYSSHALEHCWPQDNVEILGHLFRVLMPGGSLRLSVPDIRLIVKNCVDSHAFGADPLSPLFGGDYSRHTQEPDRHRQTFWLERLEKLLVEAGFVGVREWVPSQYPEIEAVKDWSSYPTISLNMEGEKPGELPSPPKKDPGELVLSVILGTVNRPKMLQECVRSVRDSLAGSGVSYEIVIAYGTEQDESLAWMRSQPDIRPILGGMTGAIDAFNAAYRASKGRLIAQLNDDLVLHEGSLAKAVEFLEQQPDYSIVVFQFDLKDGRGVVSSHFHGKLHVNQMVARREAVEAVVERIGGLWGDAAHRTDKTYGGDTAFSVWAHHLGLKMTTVRGVSLTDLCHSPESQDALRALNKQIDPDHGAKFHAMYPSKLAKTAIEPTAEDWGKMYLPRPGMASRRSPLAAGRSLRVLHLSLAIPSEMQDEMRRSLATIGPYVEIPWWIVKSKKGWEGLTIDILEAFNTHQPDLIFSQVQAKGWPEGLFNAVQCHKPKNCIWVNWSGDVRTSGTQAVQPWMAEFAGHCDLFLTSNTTYPKLLSGVPAKTGYLQCPYDPNSNPWREDESESDPQSVVFCGMNYTNLDGGKRERTCDVIHAALPGVFTVHGGGWGKKPYGKSFIHQKDASVLFRKAQVGISVSLFDDLGRYSSDRLKRMMGSGAVVAVKRFSDMEGLGLNGENCLVWDSERDLIPLLQDWIRPEREAARRKIRAAAVALAQDRFNYDVWVTELLAIVRHYRKARGL